MNIDIPILFEDNDIIVVDKPAGMTVNRAESTMHEMTLQDWAEEKLGIKVKALSIKNTDDFYKRGGVVHRLDKETSGILLLAKNPKAFENLQNQFKERTVKKTYIALAHGKVVPETGEINVPVGRLPWNRERFGIIPGGRESNTKYKVISNFKLSNEQLTLVELYPQSGRTHQIRVHLQYLGHPIFSDFLYAGRKTARKDRKLLPRVFLHAAKISFLHPVTGETLSFKSSLPEELRKFLPGFKSICAIL